VTFIRRPDDSNACFALEVQSGTEPVANGKCWEEMSLRKSAIYAPKCQQQMTGLGPAADWQLVGKKPVKQTFTFGWLDVASGRLRTSILFAAKVRGCPSAA